MFKNIGRNEGNTSTRSRDKVLNKNKEKLVGIEKYAEAREIIEQVVQSNVGVVGC